MAKTDRARLADRETRIRGLAAALPTVSDAILGWMERVVAQLGLPATYSRLPTSNLVTERFMIDFGDTLRLHHCFSEEPFSKDKFEYAIDVIARACGYDSTLASRGNPGHDITIDGTPFSLKTQANQGIRLDEILISKLMELGKGKWGSDVRDLHGMRDQFLAHMKAYDRILVLRCLERSGPTRHYELVEIPRTLLCRVKDEGVFEMKRASKQRPKPGCCRVSANGILLFELYFDGGTERKLQLHHMKKSECIVHADWKFSV